MAGFLDAKERVIDVVLTGVGKSLLMKGDLHFAYWIPFDDEVDYDPYIASSASLSASDLESTKRDKTEDPLVREACQGYAWHNGASEDRTNLNRPLFTILPGKKVLPSAIVSGSTGSIEISVRQRRIEKKGNAGVESSQVTIFDGFERFGSSRSIVEASYDDDEDFADRKLEGFLVTMYASSSDGYVEIMHNRDSGGNIVYNNDLEIDVGRK